MSEVITVAIPLGLMAEIRKALKEAGEDLHSEMLNRYNNTPKSPADQRRFERDSNSANRALLMVQYIDSQPWAYNPGWKDTKI